MTSLLFNAVRCVTEERLAAAEAIQRLLQVYEEGGAAGQTPATDWAAVRALDFDGEVLRLKEWACRLFKDSPPPEESDGLCFGFIYPPDCDLTSTVAIFVGAGTGYGEPDWIRRTTCWADEAIFHSDILTRLYHTVAAADDQKARSRALSIIMQFVASVVAEWCGGAMRHVLRGGAPRRGVFASLDDLIGFNLGELTPDRPGGAGSVIVSWRGLLKDRRSQLECVAAARQFAVWHEMRWNDLPEGKRLGFAALAKLRGHPSVPERPALRWFEEEITGRILINPEIAEDPAALLADAERAGLAIEELVANGTAIRVIVLQAIEVRGVDFKLCDPRGLYPEEDRFSFVFLRCAKIPSLDGRLVELNERSFLASTHVACVAAANWFLDTPAIHLRDFFEEWTAEMLAWVRYFFMPADFAFFHRDDTPFRYRDFIARLDGLEKRLGVAAARAYAFKGLYLDFQIEVERVLRTFGTD